MEAQQDTACQGSRPVSGTLQTSSGNRNALIPQGCFFKGREGGREKRKYMRERIDTPIERYIPMFFTLWVATHSRVVCRTERERGKGRQKISEYIQIVKKALFWQLVLSCMCKCVLAHDVKKYCHWKCG